MSGPKQAVFLSTTILFLLLGLMLSSPMLDDSVTEPFSPLQSDLEEFGEVKWSQTYGGSNGDWGNDIIAVSDGGFAITGTANHTHPGFPTYPADPGSAWLLRTDNNGDLLWERTFESEEGFSLIEMSSGGFAILADLDRLIRTDSNGVILWEKELFLESYGEFYSIVETQSGGYAIAGTSVGLDYGQFNLLVVVTDSQGTPLYNATIEQAISGDGEYGNPYTGYDIIETNSGDFYVAASVDEKFSLIKFDSECRLLWSKHLQTEEYGYGRSLIETESGDIVVIGESRSVVHVIRTDSDGNTIWVRNYTSSLVEPMSIIEMSDGGFTFSCVKDGYSSIIRVNSSGFVLAEKTYSDYGVDNAVSALLLSDGHIIAVGSFQLFESAFSRSQLWLFEIDDIPNILPSLMLSLSAGGVVLIIIVALVILRTRKYS
ncbi:MAG: hypothetical protein ACXAEF_10570 [Candidatus Thorarchaeota archaeon]|jgi:hypothetical protein